MEYPLDRALTQKDIAFLNKNKNYTLVLKNTVGIDADMLLKLDSDVIVRIIGGLDGEKKPKYKKAKYTERTLYTPIEVCKIIKKFEELEIGVDKNWTDLEKALYVYNKFANEIRYDEHDHVSSRNLRMMISGRGVCAGYALIYKEAMDRLGVECEYVNEPNRHVWNAIKIEGKWYPLDLTFDVGRRQNDRQYGSIEFFGLNENFYEGGGHWPCSEEPVIPPNCFGKSQIEAAEETLRKANAYQNFQSYSDEKDGLFEGTDFFTITHEGGVKFILAHVYNPSKGLTAISCTKVSSDEKMMAETKLLFSDISLCEIARMSSLSTENFNLLKYGFFEETYMQDSINERNGYLGSAFFGDPKSIVNSDTSQQKITSEVRSETFVRENGSSFILIEDKSLDVNGLTHFEKHGVHKYKYVEHILKDDGSDKAKNKLWYIVHDYPKQKILNVYSENTLEDMTKTEGTRDCIANELFEKSRLNKRVDEVQGYVGYVAENGLGLKKFFNKEREESLGYYRN